MSIYGTWLAIDDDEHEPECAAWRQVPEGEARAAGNYMSTWGDAYYLWVPGADCTCGNPAPLIYRGSHINPTAADKRGGCVMVCAIPNHCHPDARHDGATDDMSKRVDYLRLSVREHRDTYGHAEVPGDATVVLDREQVKRLHETLTTWLEADERW